jgi:hypothetical protein
MGRKSQAKWLKRKVKSFKRKWEYLDPTMSCELCPKETDKNYDELKKEVCKGCGRFWWPGLCEHCEFKNDIKINCQYCLKEIASGGITSHEKICPEKRKKLKKWDNEGKKKCIGCGLYVSKLTTHVLNCKFCDIDREECPNCKYQFISLLKDQHVFEKKDRLGKKKCKKCERFFSYLDFSKHSEKCKGGASYVTRRRKKKVTKDKFGIYTVGQFSMPKYKSLRTSCDHCKKTMHKNALKNHFKNCYALNDKIMTALKIKIRLLNKIANKKCIFAVKREQKKEEMKDKCIKDLIKNVSEKEMEMVPTIVMKDLDKFISLHERDEDNWELSTKMSVV